MLKVGFARVVGEERKRRLRMHTQSNQLLESFQHFRYCRAAVETNHLHTQDVVTSHSFDVEYHVSAPGTCCWADEWERSLVASVGRRCAR